MVSVRLSRVNNNNNKTHTHHGVVTDTQSVHPAPTTLLISSLVNEGLAMWPERGALHRSVAQTEREEEEVEVVLPDIQVGRSAGHGWQGCRVWTAPQGLGQVAL